MSIFRVITKEVCTTAFPSKGKASGRFANIKESASGIQMSIFRVITKEVCTTAFPSKGKASGRFANIKESASGI